MHSDGDEPRSLMDSYWFCICWDCDFCTVVSVLKERMLTEAYLQNEQEVFSEQEHKVAMWAYVSCPSDSTAA